MSVTLTLQARTVSSTTSVGEVGVAGNAASAAPASLLPSSEFSGDVATALAQLMLKTEFQNKDIAHQAKKQAQEGMKAAQDAQLSELREEADKKLSAATQEAVGQIGSGLMSAGTAGASIATSEGKETVRINNANVDQNVVKVTSDKQVGGGLGGVFEGSMKLGAAYENHSASQANIRAKADENLASAWKNDLDDAKDAKRDAQDRIGRVHDWLKSVQETTAQTTMSAIKA